MRHGRPVGRLFGGLTGNRVRAIGFPGDAYAYAAKQASLNKPNVVKYREQQSLLDLLAGESKFNGSAAGAVGGGGNAGVTVNGLNVNLDATLIDALKTPRVLYMWQGE